MAPLHLSSTSRALYRVFIAPYLTSTTHRTPFSPPKTLPLPSQFLLPTLFLRNKSFSRKDVTRHSLHDDYILDTAIRSTHINLVDMDGKFWPSISLEKTLSQINRSSHHVLQVAPGKLDPHGYPDPAHPPTCKIISKQDLRIQHNKKLELDRIRVKQAKAGSKGKVLGSKSLELNWAIDRNDLGHRCERLREFLEEGRKVEVMLGPKKRGRKASEDECQDVLAKVRSVVAEVKGAIEGKVEGKLGGIMTLNFEGKKGASPG